MIAVVIAVCTLASVIALLGMMAIAVAVAIPMTTVVLLGVSRCG
ncbi:hypothetical protein ULG90_01095 [Halopseudomonas pachastrellae]|nr:hypothetical protein ULG90_01095 [Halopseudomonas pachastrellae]